METHKIFRGLRHFSCTKKVIFSRTLVTRPPKKGLLPNEDIMGLPDAKSNLRALKVHIPKNETTEERTYRLEREQLQSWNQIYWEKHNHLFNQEKEKFIEIKLAQSGKPTSLNAEEMAVFYKQFLNQNHNKHVQYNWEWYRKNFYILWLSFHASMSKLFKKT